MARSGEVTKDQAKVARIFAREMMVGAMGVPIYLAATPRASCSWLLMALLKRRLRELPERRARVCWRCSWLARQQRAQTIREIFWREMRRAWKVQEPVSTRLRRNFLCQLIEGVKEKQKKLLPSLQPHV
jgi:hypothetical protein